MEKFRAKQGDYETTGAWFEAMMHEIHSEINVVIDQVKVQMKENNAQMPPTGKDIVVQFQTLIHDAALIRQLLFSAQQALFEGSNGASHPQLP